MNGDTATLATRSAVELSEFQEDAVKKARRILARYDGVIIADSVGFRARPGSARNCWKTTPTTSAKKRWSSVRHRCAPCGSVNWASATIAVTVISQESLGQDNFDVRSLADVDIILVDEAHNFRNRHVKRYQMLETLLAANGRRGRDGGRKKLILLTATPINNNIFDLYNEINLFAGNDLTYFAVAGIGDLYK